MSGRGVIGWALVLAVWGWPSGAAIAQEEAQASAAARQDRLSRLVQRIVTGDEVQAAAATEQYLDAVTAPIADAIAELDKTEAVAARLRLMALMQRLSGEVRYRAFRADLAPADQALVDRFERAYPELTRALFGDNFRERAAAVRQIPLAPNTGAGVLIAAKINDADEAVAMAALEAAQQLADPVVARNVAEYVRVVTEVMREGFYGPSPDEQLLARTVAKVFVLEALEVLAKAGEAEHADVVARAIEHFSTTKYWDKFDRGRALEYLRGLAQRDQLPLLAQFLDDQSLLGLPRFEDKRLTQAVSDVAFAAILRVLDEPAEKYGLEIRADAPEKLGFVDDAARDAAVQRLKQLLRERGVAVDGGLAIPEEAGGGQATQPGPTRGAPGG